MFRKAGICMFYTGAMVGSTIAGVKIEEHREKEFRAAHPGKEIKVGTKYIGGIGFCNNFEVKEPENTIETRPACAKG